MASGMFKCVCGQWVRRWDRDEFDGENHVDCPEPGDPDESELNRFLFDRTEARAINREYFGGQR